MPTSGPFASIIILVEAIWAPYSEEVMTVSITSLPESSKIESDKSNSEQISSSTSTSTSTSTSKSKSN
ncbi:hypothetical protein NIES4071_100670 [Calothrix sp. NIES-4071]|nr:hypothetical protein NIES4071_100670 [Calothrix sp. NIES-4071]BAZ64327.1 hypothetical protein NIES4105_100600 [Calothrix sp. NIES-4105]